MLTLDDVKRITKGLPLGSTTTPDHDLGGDVTCIVYRTDLFHCGEGMIVNRHIDIEFAFGDYYELHDGEELFQSICSFCDLPVVTAGETEEEIVIYQK